MGSPPGSLACPPHTLRKAGRSSSCTGSRGPCWGEGVKRALMGWGQQNRSSRPACNSAQPPPLPFKAFLTFSNLAESAEAEPWNVIQRLWDPVARGRIGIWKDLCQYLIWAGKRLPGPPRRSPDLLCGSEEGSGGLSEPHRHRIYMLCLVAHRCGPHLCIHN